MKTKSFLGLIALLIFIGVLFNPPIAKTQTPQFRIPIIVVDSFFNSPRIFNKVKRDTILIGIHPDATYCLDQYELTGFQDRWFHGLPGGSVVDSQKLQEYELPPIPMGFDIRLKNAFSYCPPGVPSLGLGVKYNIHQFVNSTQIDTFQMIFQKDATDTLKQEISFEWPSVLSEYCTSLRLVWTTRVNEDMLVKTKFIDTNLTLIPRLNVIMTGAKVPPGPPAQAQITSPVGGDTTVPYFTTLQWSPRPNTYYYMLQIGTDSLFTNMIVDDTLSGTSKQLSYLHQSQYYYSRVLVVNKYGVTAFPPNPYRFKTRNIALYPVNGSTNVALNPSLTWNSLPSTSPVTYKIQVANDPGFAPASLHTDTITTDTTYRISSLQNCLNYYWRIRTTNALGTGPWSTPLKFRTILSTPALPSLNSPVDNTTDVDLKPTLSWSTNDPCADTYHFQVATDVNFSNLIVDLITDQKSYTFSSFLEQATDYYWRVKSKNATDSSQYTTHWKFTTKFIPAPATPTLIYPTDGLANVLSCITLAWDSSLYALYYRVQVALDASFIILKVDDSTIAAQPSILPSRLVCGLLNSTKYYWRVYAKNNLGSSSWSQVRNFTTLYPPDAPRLISPTNGSSKVPVTPIFDWSLAQRADAYRLQVALDTVFDKIVFNDTSITELSWELYGVLNSVTKYYWRVRAKNQIGWGAWSSISSFTTTYRGAANWIVPITVAEFGPQRETIYMGVHPQATSGIDGILGEFTLPPVASGYFDARFISPLIGEGLLMNIVRFYNYSQVDTFQVYFQPGMGTYPITFSWSRDFIYSACDSMVITDQIKNPTIRKRMDIDTSMIVSNSTIKSVYIIKYGAYPMPTDIEVKPIASGIPSGFVLYQNYPNPFNPTTNIEFSTDRSAKIQTKIYDILGRELCTIVDASFFPGKYTFLWNGKDAEGVQMPSGVYYVRFTAQSLSEISDNPQFIATRKMLMVK
ncbi:MAG: FlgD immunoglobulin-like domain containing protein [Bacteroidota bacterium]|nr:FlgD immunoglobulin-like domain containing protein [Bacteroidota bacterium]